MHLLCWLLGSFRVWIAVQVDCGVIGEVGSTGENMRHAEYDAMVEF